jgi:hypothetical protein
MTIKGLVGRKVTKDVTFCGEQLKISKLSVAEVMDIQALAKKSAARGDDETDDNDSIDMLRLVIRAAAEGGPELSDEDFGTFPMDELSKLVGEIMSFSGVGGNIETGKEATAA